VKVNEWNSYEIIARGGVMMHIMNGQLMAAFIDDNQDSVEPLAKSTSSVEQSCILML
jgi:hypothetical protein